MKREEDKKIKSVNDLIVYQKACLLFDMCVEEDVTFLQQTTPGRALINNHIRSIDSICATMEEGYERSPIKDRKHFFIIAKGSAGEARERYTRLRKLLPKDIIAKRISLTYEVSA